MDEAEFNVFCNANAGCIFVGHNFLAYDLPVLNRLWNAGIGTSRVVDTFVLSQLYNPTLNGGHSLEAWGKRVKHPKGEHNDFSKFTQEMLEYCRNDVSLTAVVYRKLSQRMVSVGFTELGCEIEHKAWNIIQNKQRRHGFPFNKQGAELLLAELQSREAELRQEIYKQWPPEYTCVASYARGRKADGSRTAHYLRHAQQYPELRDRPDGGYDAFDWVEFNLGSPSQRLAKLLEVGWQPTSETPKGNPKVDEDSLILFAETTGNEAGKALAKWLVINSRITNMLRPWLDAYNEKTHCIHGRLFIASTLRYRHSNPNTANIPAVRTDKEKGILYGEEGSWAYECRNLWGCGDPTKYSLVGVDAKGIQIRILLNYAYSDEAVELYLNGDPHVNNAKVLGLANKPAAKKFFYTLIMGGAGKRLAADQAQFGTKLTAKEGAAMKERMIETIPGFKKLITRLEDELNDTGRIRLCDGTPILVPSPHMVIPYLLQGDESRIMKLAGVWLEREIKKRGLTAWKVGDIHDEWQFVVSNGDVPTFVEVATAVFPKVGEFFNYKLPIEGDAKIGKTWAETH